MVLKGKVSAASEGYTLNKGFAHLAAGLTCGLCGLGAGYAIGIVGDAGKCFNILLFVHIRSCHWYYTDYNAELFRCAWNSTAASSVRRNDPYPHFL